MYRKEYPGDNPMAVETEDKTNSIKEELQKAYEDFKKKDQRNVHSLNQKSVKSHITKRNLTRKMSKKTL